jgi:hypothetical protein
MNKEDKLSLLNNELAESIKEHKRINDIVVFCSDELEGFPFFYSPFEHESEYVLNQMQDKIDWLQAKIQEIEAQ